MRILFSCVVTAATLTLSGCFGEDFSDPITDTMAQTPFMYKPDIQQGNVVTQDQINKLEPGMDREQVRFLMGTPLLVDTFHQDRWDYIYSIKRGGNKAERKRISLFFKDNQLSGMEGDMRPDPNAEPAQTHSVVSVPDYTGGGGLFSSTLKAVGLEEKDTPKVDKKAAEVATEGVTAEGVAEELEQAAQGSVGDAVPEIPAETSPEVTTEPAGEPPVQPPAQPSPFSH